MENKKKSNVWLIMCLVIIILGLAGYICYDKFLSKKEEKNNKQTSEKGLSSYVVNIDEIISSIVNPTFDKAQTKSAKLRINDDGYLEYIGTFRDDEPFKIHEKLKGTKIKSFIEVGDERGPLGNIILAQDGTLYFQEDEDAEVIATPGKVEDITYVGLNLFDNCPMLIIVKIDNKLYCLDEEDFKYKLSSKELSDAIKELSIYSYQHNIMGEKRVEININGNYFKDSNSNDIKVIYYIISKEDKSIYLVTNEYVYRLPIISENPDNITLVGKIADISNDTKSLTIKYSNQKGNKTLIFNNNLTNEDLSNLLYQMYQE